MISIKQLTVAFGATPLFNHISYVINKKDRIALVGKNGAGKSTMLKILAGMQMPTDGEVSVPKDVKIGYLPQVMKLEDGRTVREEAAQAFHELFSMRDQVKSLEKEMSERTDYESQSYHELIEKYTHAEEQYRMHGGENYQAELERTLLGLGFSRVDLDRATREFSGGWRMRIELAKILLRKPDLLLLDEPTNHLDIESITWLEKFLSTSSAALMLVSHDRAFINHVTNRTLEITCGRLEDYKVPYDKYLMLREERREQQLKAYDNQQKLIAETESFIERFRYKATKSNQVQSRVKMLEKIDRIEIDPEDRSQLHLKFPPASRSGDYPVIAEDVAKSYGSQLVFSGVNLVIERGQKVAFVGKNGEGKSTLVKAILGDIPYEGTLTIGHGVEIGYFAQNQAQLLDDNLSIYETIDYVAKGEVRTQIPSILGAFMFGGEISEKKVQVLSGGERTRLAMIKLMLEPANLLILDEPTNHLDLKSKDVLKEALKSFNGTVILVSHDRDFLDGLVDNIYEFGGGKVKHHIGGIYEFLSRKELEMSQAQKLDVVFEGDNKLSKSPTVDAKLSDHHQVDDSLSDSSVKNQKTLSYAEQKEQQKQLRKLQKSVEQAEKKITDTETEIAQLEERMIHESDPSIYEVHGQLKKRLEEETSVWEEAMMKLEEQQI